MATAAGAEDKSSAAPTTEKVATPSHAVQTATAIGTDTKPDLAKPTKVRAYALTARTI